MALSHFLVTPSNAVAYCRQIRSREMSFLFELVECIKSSVHISVKYFSDLYIN